MGRYRLVFKPSAERAFLALPKDVQKRLDKRLRFLQDNPRPPGVKPLTSEPGVLRLRGGDYRVLYEVHNDVVTVLVLKIGHRCEPQYHGEYGVEAQFLRDGEEIA